MNNQDALLARFEWWSALKHGGLLIAPSKLPERLPEAPKTPSHFISERLRRAVVRVLDGDDTALPLLMDVVLQDILELPATEWTKGASIDAGWSHRALTREVIKPRRIWQGRNKETLPVFVADGSLGGKVARLGVGRGRRSVSRVVEWLRNAGQKVALLTNGRQWRLVHAGADYEAFCEWDIDLWFVEGAPGPQVDALRALLGRASLSKPTADQESPLVDAILASRKGQAELSGVLGERVRMAVEHLIKVSSASIVELRTADPTLSMRDFYVAASRMVMRCIVVLFAEARELLPRDNEIYDGSYGLQALRAQLDRAAGGRGADRLRHAQSAWPRLMSLFRLVHAGSAHEALPIPTYAGKLFEPSSLSSSDAVLRALYAFETRQNNPSDAAVHRILELLTRSRVKVRQGRGSTWVEAPVDFSDLSSEYIGILYEGLLDFELRQAPDDDAVVFLNIGAEPALPFARLDGMTVSERKGLLEKLKTSAKKAAVDEGGDEEETEDEDEAVDDSVDEDDVELEGDDDGNPEDDESGDVAELISDDDVRRHFSEAVDIWARNAVRDAGWCKRGADFSDPQVVSLAKGLIRRIVLPGEFFLVRWGGTRKGSGTFYTRPQLAGPTTRRTLRPLAYRATKERTDEETGLVDVLEWEPKKPEEILELKVCDPAMGSGSFLVSALRFLVDALVESLHFHCRLDSNEQRTICRLADGLPVEHPSQETLPVPADDPDFEDRLRSRLRRHVVERCLYGVDLDPLAVELGQMALWVETMDRSLPFSFLDHKLKVGNSLVGCWLDRFEDYPVMAWEREGGDAKHERFVHHKRTHVFDKGAKKGQTEERGDVWTDAIKQRKALVKSDMVDLLSGQRRLGAKVPEARAVHAKAHEVFEALHSLPVHEVERRAEAYLALQEDEEFLALRRAFDAWCALWFWPGDALHLAPMPLGFPWDSEGTQNMVADVAATQRFFHWELEFPDAFTPTRSGFDAVIGNPPWDTIQPASKEFFSNIDPMYLGYGKQEALSFQRRHFEADPTSEREWVSYMAHFKSLANYVRQCSEPFSESSDSAHLYRFCRHKRRNEILSQIWLRRRRHRHGYANPDHPFRLQGEGKPYTYRLFVEVGIALLRKNGRLGLLVPAGIYSDKGARALREYMLDGCCWEWLYSFENRFRVFDIHRSFKFCALIIEKSRSTRAVRTAFMVRDIDAWQDERPSFLPYSRGNVERFSPKMGAILEFERHQDATVVSTIYSHGVLVGAKGPASWGIRYQQGDFNMTSDSRLFPALPVWKRRGFLADEYGHWLRGPWESLEAFGFNPQAHSRAPESGRWSVLERPMGLVVSSDGTRAIPVDEIVEVALPLFEGRMIGQFDFSQKGWLSGKGRGSVWRDLSFPRKAIEPQFMVSSSQAGQLAGAGTSRITFMDVTSSTNKRTFIGATIPAMPSGHSAPFLLPASGRSGAVLASLNSLATDWVFRRRVGGLHLTWNYLEEVCVIPSRLGPLEEQLEAFVLSLSAVSSLFATRWREAAVSDRATRPWRSMWAVTPLDRLRLRCILDAAVAELYGLDVDDFAWILRDCDHPIDLASSSEFTRKLDPKGFWRVDKEKHPELRHTVLSLVAFHELKRMGLEAFLAQNDGEGWMLPETLRLADYGLGHNDRVKSSQPVASVLGPRFYDWQLEQDVEESWEECRRHAELIRKIRGLPENNAPSGQAPAEAAPKKPVRKDLFGKPVATDLFGEPIATKPRRR